MVTVLDTHHICEGVENNVSGTFFYWWKSNFNMPVPNIIDNTSGWTQTDGPFNYYNEATSFDLTGFSPGFEAMVGFVVFSVENTGATTYNINTLIRARWTDPSLNTINYFAYDVPWVYSLAPGDWTGYEFGGNVGVASWEIGGNGNYHFRSSLTGVPDTATHDTPVTITNCPSTSMLPSGKEGYIWVEGDNLCYVNYNLWKHSMIGLNVGYVDVNKAGYFWMDTSSVLHWIGDSGDEFIAEWEVQQFASTWSNSATHATNAGTSKRGYMWVDNEFGNTHLAYIGYNGYKFLTGAGDYPYSF